MNILIPHNWLLDYLKTLATPQKIGEYLSLCGPSVEKIEKKANTHIYHFEVTTNRVDAASIFGIAREASAILPRFGISASLKLPDTKSKQKFVNKVKYLNAQVDHKLCPRFSAVLIKNVKIKSSPSWMKERLEAVGVRAINNCVDISNYIMHEIGQPVHTFDYDKIRGATMKLRESRKAEKIITLDGQTHELGGGDIVIENGEGRLIDLAGIMGAENSAVDWNTKNVLLFVQTYNPVNIRRTSMSLAKRSEAATLFEKGLDPELVRYGIVRGIQLFEKFTDGVIESEVLDSYPKPYKPKIIRTPLSFIEEILGISLQANEVVNILESLDFKASRFNNQISVEVPSFRANDIEIPEDIVEEVARIYGYHNLPSVVMSGKIPEPLNESQFEFESKVKEIFKAFSGVEVYTLSMVSKEEASENALKLKNPLGKDSEYLRGSLMPSLIRAAKQNSADEPYHLFEIANVYIPRKNDLPEEKMQLAGVFSNYDYREAKGVIEALLEELRIEANFIQKDTKYFHSNRSLVIKTTTEIGIFGALEETGLIYYEFEIEKLVKSSKPTPTFNPIPKFPPQIEDITLILPERTKVAEVIDSIYQSSSLIENVELTDIYENSFTFRIKYLHPDKTLTDKEVEDIRGDLLQKVKKKFGAQLKE